jgi:galactose mutarotase-like enzyme
MSQTASTPPIKIISLVDTVAGTSAEIAPSRGGLVTSLRVRGRELLYLDEATFTDATKNVRGGIPILFPTPGKLIDDAWRYGDRTGVLKQHGFARNSVWTTEERSDSTLVLSLTSDAATLAQYPWQFRATIRFTLTAHLRLSMRIENRANTPMPFGLGYHPYFRVADKLHTQIASRATRAFDNVLRQVVPFSGFDLTQNEVDLHLLDHDSDLCALTYPDGSTLEVLAAQDFRRWVVWTLARKEFVCVEPWTSPGNALNTGEDLVILPVGATHDSWIDIGLGAATS